MENIKTQLVVSKFFEGISDNALYVNDSKLELNVWIEYFSDMMTEAFYIIDFHRRRFRYVADHDFFLCGYKSEEAM
jgi:hypothetical protein